MTAKPPQFPPSIYNELYQASLYAPIESEPTAPPQGQMPEQRRKRLLIDAVASLWRPAPQTMMDMRHDSKQEIVRHLLDIGRLIDPMINFLSQSPSNIARISEWLLNDKGSLPLASLGQSPGEPSASGRQPQSIDRHKQDFDTSYLASRDFVGDLTKKRDDLIATYNLASLHLYALTFYKDWSALAFGVTIPILELQKELSKIKAEMGKFKSVHLTDEVDPQQKGEFDALVNRFQDIRAKLLILENDDRVKPVESAVKQKLAELPAVPANLSDSVPVKSDDLMEEGKQQQEAMSRTIKLLYQHLLHIVEKTYSEVITMGLCLENEIALLGFVFELEIPANRFASSCRTMAPRFDAAYKALGSDPNLTDLEELHQKWFEEFKKQVQTKGQIQEKFDRIAQPFDGFFTRTLSKRWYAQKEHRPEAKIFPEVMEEMEYRKKDFFDRVGKTLADIGQCLQEQAYSKTISSLDYIECYIIWKKADAYRVSWLAYLATHQGTAAAYLNSAASLEKKEDASMNKFRALFNVLPQVLLPQQKPSPSQVRNKPRAEKSQTKQAPGQKGKSVTLFDKTKELSETLHQAFPKTAFFDCLFQAPPPQAKELFDYWQVENQVVLQLDIDGLQSLFQDIQKQVKGAVEWSNVLVNAFNIQALLMLALEHSSEFVHRFHALKQVEAARVRELSTFKDRLKPFDGLEFAQEDQLSSELLGKFNAIILPETLKIETLFQEEKELIDAIRTFEPGQDKDLAPLKGRSFTVEFLQTSKRSEGSWVHRGAQTMRSQKLQLLHVLKQGVASAPQHLTDALVNVHHYFRIHYLFHVTAEANRLLADTGRLKKGAEDLGKGLPKDEKKKLEQSVIASVMKGEDVARNYTHWQEVFTRSLERVASFHAAQAEGGKDFQAKGSKLLTELELLKFYASTQAALKLFEETKHRLSSRQERVLMQTKLIGENIDKNLADTAKFLDAAFKKQKCKEKSGPSVAAAVAVEAPEKQKDKEKSGPSAAVAVVVEASEKPNTALWEAHQKSIAEAAVKVAQVAK